MKRILAMLLVLCCLAALLSGCEQTERKTIVIAMPRGEFIRNMDTNYYIEWLEQQTGLKLSFVYLDESYTAQSMEKAFSEGDISVEAFFSFDVGGDYLTALSTLAEYGEKGYILPLESYLDGTTQLEQIFSNFEGYDLRAAMTSPDGSIYFMPGLDGTRSQSVGSMLWMNKSWLNDLSLPLATTAEEFRQVLLAFQTSDPNGNGQPDEIPLCGSVTPYGQQSYNVIINAFVYNDPENSRLFVEDGEVHFAPMTNEWREAIQYLNGLYTDGLLSPLQFEISERSMSELAANPRDILGAFTSDHVTSVLMQNSPEILSSYSHVAPLAGPSGVQLATAKTTLPQVNGVITANCKSPEAVFRLFDLMLSNEAFLIGRFGEKDVDWTEAAVTDMDFYGRAASIRVLNNLQNKMQNKHICELGPFFAYSEYADGVTFTGFESDQEYMNARAQLAYESFLPKESLGALLYTGAVSSEAQALRADIDAYTDDCIVSFITGELDPYDDLAWDDMLREYGKLGVDELLIAVRDAYMGGN